MGTQGRQRDQQHTRPQVPTGIWAQAEGVKWGTNGRGTRRKSSHAERGAETSSGGTPVAGLGEVQVDNVPRLDRIWGVGVTAIER